MPFTFPSHQGLVAPLWRRWPGVFDAPALFIGAAMPDVVDGIAGAFYGYLGHGLGHSLIALPLLCVPGGLALWWLAHIAAQRLPASTRSGFLAHSWNVGLEAIVSTPSPHSGEVKWGKIGLSLGIGAGSHLFFDLISHGHFTLFYPWATEIRLFPDWWHIAWARLSVPGYQDPYPVGPHLLMWLFLGTLGIYLLFAPVYRDERRRHRETAASTPKGTAKEESKTMR